MTCHLTPEKKAHRHALKRFEYRFAERRVRCARESDRAQATVLRVRDQKALQRNRKKEKKTRKNDEKNCSNDAS